MIANYSLMFILVFLLIACNSNKQNQKEQSGATADSTTKGTIIENSYSVKTFMVGNYWGYGIYKNNQLFIHQPNIPAIEGNQGFSSEQKAMITATLTIQKLKNGIMPPTLSIQELDSLNVIE